MDHRISVKGWNEEMKINEKCTKKTTENKNRLKSRLKHKMNSNIHQQ